MNMPCALIQHILTLLPSITDGIDIQYPSSPRVYQELKEKVSSFMPNLLLDQPAVRYDVSSLFIFFLSLFRFDSY